MGKYYNIKEDLNLSIVKIGKYVEVGFHDESGFLGKIVLEK